MVCRVPTLSTLVVTYNSAAHIGPCLESLLASRGFDAVEILVVDNASADATRAIITARFPTVRLIASPVNLGFAAANNLAARQATGDYLAIVNPDLTVPPDSLRRLVDYLEQAPAVGIAGPRTLDTEGRVTLSARPPYSLWHILGMHWYFGAICPRLIYGRYVALNRTADLPVDVGWLQGSCLVLRRSLFEQLGGFDESFFLYVEDIDLCDRARQQGYRIVFVPMAMAVHLGGATTRAQPLMRVRGYHASPLHYFRKRQKPLHAFLIRGIFILELLVKPVLRGILNRIRYSAERQRQADAEWQVLREVLGNAYSHPPERS